MEVETYSCLASFWYQPHKGDSEHLAPAILHHRHRLTL